MRIAAELFYEPEWTTIERLGSERTWRSVQLAEGQHKIIGEWTHSPVGTVEGGA